MITLTLKSNESIHIYNDEDIENGNITLSQFIDFKAWDHQYHKQVREGDDGMYERGKAVQLLCGGSDELWGSEPYSDGKIENKKEYFIGLQETSVTIEKLYYHHFNLFNGWIGRKLSQIKEIIKTYPEKKQEDLKELVAIMGNENSSLYESMKAILIFSEVTGDLTYAKDKLKFKHRRKSFTVGVHTIKKYYGELGFTFSDTILVKQLRKTIKERITKLTDAEGMFEMEMSLYELAILCKGKSDQLPINPKKRDLFMKQRARLFQDIPMIRYYQVCFFLITSLVDLGINLTINHFGKTFMKDLETLAAATQRPTSKTKSVKQE